MSGWRDSALCRDDPEGQFPHDSDKAGIADAKALCRRCPAVIECADWALNARPKVTYGVAGALSEADRERIWRAQERQVGREQRQVRQTTKATVATLTTQGQSAAEISLRLGISARTVVRYRTRTTAAPRRAAR